MGLIVTTPLVVAVVLGFSLFGSLQTRLLVMCLHVAFRDLNMTGVLNVAHLLNYFLVQLTSGWKFNLACHTYARW